MRHALSISAIACAIALALAGCGGASEPGAADAASSVDSAGPVDGAGQSADGRVLPDAWFDVGDAGVGRLWADDFEGTTGAIEDHDPSWRTIFGQLDVADGAVLANPGPEDGRDDYGYKPQSASALVITADVFWSHADAVGVIVVCPPGSQDESLYEITIYADRLQLLRYDGGGNPSVYETLAQTAPLSLSDGNYRIVMVAELTGSGWTLSGELRDPASGFAVVGEIGATQDATHGASIGQGIGIYDNSKEQSRIFAIDVAGRL